MITEVFNRFEKKFMVNDDTLKVLLKKLDGFIIEDSHCKGQEFYNICNIYYDTLSDELIRNSIEKPTYKEKLRLRSYGVPGLNDNTFLEIKKKFKNTVNKRRITLPLDHAYKFIEDKKISDIPGINQQIANEIIYFLNRYEVIPKLYLAYDRKAYYGIDDDNLRITFDTNIITRRNDLNLEMGNYGELLLGKGLWLMEVKVTGAVPLWLAEILSECNIYSTSFSKYGAAYKKNISNTINSYRGEVKCLSQYLKVQPTQDLKLVQQSLVS